jgi:hypothetical protein
MKPAFRRGFSFTEIVVALFVMSVGILPLFWFFSRANAGTMSSRDKIQAQVYASELISFARAQGAAALDTTADEGIDFPEIVVGSEKTVIEEKFERRLIVKAISPADHNPAWPVAYKLVTARVTWVADEIAHSFNQSLLLTDGGSD